MKKFIAIFIECIVAFTLFNTVQLSAQQSGESVTYLWPVEGARTGADILYTPQCYIDKELNFDNLVIAAPEGTNVVCPVDGTIKHISAGYLQNLSFSICFNKSENAKNFDQMLEESRASIVKSNKSIDPKYIHGTIAILTEDGKTIYISGLTGSEEFKTGQKLEKGRILGQVGYWYRSIPQPCIEISISINSKPADPMTPFGLKTTFIKPTEIKPIESLTQEQALEDFRLFIEILKDCYPGLNDVVSENELAAYSAESVKYIENYGGSVPYNDFWRLLRRTTAKIHDSHLFLYNAPWIKETRYPPYQPQIYFGWFSDTLTCNRAVKEYEQYIGRQIHAINGIPADSIKKIVTANVTDYDAKVESYIHYRLATVGLGPFFNPPYGSQNFDMKVDFVGGEQVEIKGADTKKGFPVYTTDWTKFFMLNWYRDGYATKMLNDSTAYIGLSTFELNQTQEEAIVSFIDSVAQVPHLVFDVRNNPGGDMEVLKRIFSHIATDTLRLNGYTRVNRKGGFKTLKYSMNYTQGISEKPEDELFPDFVAEEGKDGYFNYSDSHSLRVVIPDTAVNYRNKIYVLSNENSISAATVFPALVVRSHRGIVVGRETRTAYHFMNALKFTEMRLPHSMISFRVPLMQVVFDNVVNSRVPYGRGVLPDYYVPLTLDEVTFRNGDAILNFTLKLIEKGRYLSPENPFATDLPGKAPRSPLYNIISIIAGIILLFTVILLTNRYFRRSRRS